MASTSVCRLMANWLGSAISIFFLNDVVAALSAFLHPGIGEAKHDHGLEFLSNDSFVRIGAESRRRLVEEHRQVDLDRAGLGQVTKADIDDDPHPGAINGGRGFEPKAAKSASSRMRSTVRPSASKLTASSALTAQMSRKAAITASGLASPNPKRSRSRVGRCGSSIPCHQHRAFQYEAVSMRAGT